MLRHIERNELTIQENNNNNHTIPSLMALCTPVIHTHEIKYSNELIPQELVDYLNNSIHCDECNCKVSQDSINKKLSVSRNFSRKLFFSAPPESVIFLKKLCFNCVDN